VGLAYIQAMSTAEAEQIALVTGAGSGIGRATALQLARRGCAVACADLAPASASEAAAAIEAAGGTALAVAVDVGDGGQVAAMMTQVHEQLGPVSVLAACAGICRRGSVLDIAVEDWDRMMAVNVRGTFLCVQQALPDMLHAGYGRIVLISSVAGRTGGLLVSADYCASKGAILAFAKAVAREVADRGVTVNVVAPGATRTALNAGWGDDTNARITQQIPTGRQAEPDEIAAAIAFLASPEAASITGATLDINGGLIMV
jgi:NAD(P)-dependent dehydrogenase (short-subunit alcohol dehydrogenase family)